MSKQRVDSSDLPIFLDNHSTTPVDPRVAAVVMNSFINDFGNASSVDHIFGDVAAQAVEDAKNEVLRLVNTISSKVVFTSGATEALNLVLQDQTAIDGRKPVIAVTPLEHPSILLTCDELVRRNLIDLVFFEVDRHGRMDLGNVEHVLQGRVDLACIMAANNEIGTINPMEEIAQVCHKYGAKILCDATQAAGKVPIDFDKWQLTYLVISAHKMYGPKGVGALITNRKSLPRPLFWGGEHQAKVRPGTLNVPGIVGLGEACRLRRSEMTSDEQAVGRRRDCLQKMLTDTISGVIVNGDPSCRLAGNLHVSIPGIVNDAVIARIRDRVAISTGSACSSGDERASHVLRALKLTDWALEGALRIGVGKFNTDVDIQRAGTILVEEITKVRQLLGSSENLVRRA